MKNRLQVWLLALAALLPAGASAQYYQIANQAGNMLQNVFRGGSNYKGYVEAGYTKTVGRYSSDSFEFSTSQGFRRGWFYMGAGLGVDILNAHTESDWGQGWERSGDFDLTHKSSTTAVMMPLFTDFRGCFGDSGTASFFFGIKIGCSFLLGDKYVPIGNGYLTSSEYFYLKPSMGIRIPTNSKHPSQGVDIALHYKLLTSNYWNSWSRNITLNGIGASVAYEW